MQIREVDGRERFDVWPHTALRRLAGEVRRMRFQARTAFMRDFTAAYTGTNLGVIWNIILPLLPIMVYAMLSATRVVPQFGGAPTAVVIGLNATLWFFFVGCVQIPINITLSRNAEAMKTAVPLIVSIVAGFGSLMFDTMIRLTLVAVMAVVWDAYPAASAFGTILVVLLAGMLFFGLGLFLAIANVAAPDVQKVTSSVLVYGLFLSGVIFPLPEAGPLSVLTYANPFAVFIEAAREWTFEGPSIAVPLIAWSMAAPFALLLGARVFYVMEQRVRGLV